MDSFCNSGYNLYRSLWAIGKPRSLNRESKINRKEVKKDSGEQMK